MKGNIHLIYASNQVTHSISLRVRWNDVRKGKNVYLLVFTQYKVDEIKIPFTVSTFRSSSLGNRNVTLSHNRFCHSFLFSVVIRSTICHFIYWQTFGSAYRGSNVHKIISTRHSTYKETVFTELPPTRKCQ